MIWRTRFGILFLVIIVIPIFKNNFVSGIGAVLILMGGLLNLIAMEANGGKMSVFKSNEKKGPVIYEFGKSTHKDGTSSTKFPYLCDGIEITVPIFRWTYRCTISIGDVIINVGVLLFLLMFPKFVIILIA